MTLKNRGCSRSQNMAPFDRAYTTFYWSAIVNIGLALSCTVFELFDVELYKCEKKLRFRHELTANDTSKTAKNYKKVITHQHIA